MAVDLSTIGDSRDAGLFFRATRDRKRVVSWSWVEACVRERRLVPIDDSALYVPPPTAAGHPAMRGLRVCLTGYQARPASASASHTNSCSISPAVAAGAAAFAAEAAAVECLTPLKLLVPRNLLSKMLM